VALDTEKIRRRLEAVAREEAELSEADARDVAFHMTDWLENLRAFYQFCERPESLSNEQVGEMVMAFLIHVPNHVAAAGKLYTDIPVTDIFKVGATSRAKVKK
jgi:hypothetical protein